MIVDSWVINIMHSTSQDGGEDFKISKDRLKKINKQTKISRVKVSGFKRCEIGEELSLLYRNFVFNGVAVRRGFTVF